MLEIFRKHAIDALAIHGRTVEERYSTPVHPDCVKLAVDSLPCPVIANGNVVDVPTGLAYLEKSGAAGLMIGRGAIRNPWLFAQLRAALEGTPPPAPTCRDLLDHVLLLHDELAASATRFDELGHVQRMKKTMVFVTQGHDPDFEFRIRRAKTPDDFHSPAATTSTVTTRCPPPRKKVPGSSAASRSCSRERSGLATSRVHPFTHRRKAPRARSSRTPNMPTHWTAVFG